MNRPVPEIDAASLEAVGRALSPAVERPAPAVPQTWDASNPRGLTVATMTTAEYGAWLDAGKPR